jgi:hypothetical protein
VLPPHLEWISCGKTSGGANITTTTTTTIIFHSITRFGLGSGRLIILFQEFKVKLLHN